MYIVRKKLEIAASHRLELNYDSPCENLHGHNWEVYVWCKNDKLDENDMVVDFSLIKKLVHKPLDHKYLNDELNFNPTAENIAKWICHEVPYCFKVEIYESKNNYCCYEL